MRCVVGVSYLPVALKMGVAPFKPAALFHQDKVPEALPRSDSGPIKKAPTVIPEPFSIKWDYLSGGS